MPKNDFVTRSITGTLFVTSIIVAIYVNTIFSALVFGLFLIMSIIEFNNLFKSSNTIKLAIKELLFFSIFIYCFGIYIILFQVNLFLFIAILPIVFISFLTEIWNKKEQPIINLSVKLFAYSYLVIPFILIVYLANETSFEFPLLTGMFLLIWTNDSFAYLSGRLFGKNKFFERISPNKTWEGVIGGFLFTIIFSYIISSFLNDGTNLVFWFVSALIISPSAILGDLLESLFKRSLNIKDTGKILPGHGGILDRFDATLFTTPLFFFWYITYFYLVV
jgi:phosphatidate cytidylyltransferase